VWQPAILANVVFQKTKLGLTAHAWAIIADNSPNDAYCMYG